MQVLCRTITVDRRYGLCAACTYKYGTRRGNSCVLLPVPCSTWLLICAAVHLPSADGGVLSCPIKTTAWFGCLRALRMACWLLRRRPISCTNAPIFTVRRTSALCHGTINQWASNGPFRAAFNPSCQPRTSRARVSLRSRNFHESVGAGRGPDREGGWRGGSCGA